MIDFSDTQKNMKLFQERLTKKLGVLGRSAMLAFSLIGILSIVWLLFQSPLFSVFENNKYDIKSASSVVTRMKALNRLETASFTIEKIIDAGTAGNRLQQVLFGDRLLLIAHGEVIAGFDLSQMSEDDIKIIDDTMTIILPKPQILFTSLDNEKTRVYDRQKGLLTTGDKDLESEARIEAERVIRSAACSAEILETASQNAREQLGALFSAAGFTSVTIAIPQADC